MDNKKFLKLQRKWDAKLRRAGFDDIEVTPSGYREEESGYVKGHTNHITRQVDRGIPQRKAEWYRLSAQWLNERSWPSNPRWNIRAWELLSNGDSAAQVLRELNSTRKANKISYKAFSTWFAQENAAMTEALCHEPYERTASYGELVYLRGVLEEVRGDYVWEVRLSDGQSVEVHEDDLRYTK